jgi:hypothetical protein
MSSLDLGFRRVSEAPLLDLSAVPWCAEEERPRPSVIFPTVVDMAALRERLGAPALPGVPGAPPEAPYFLYYAPHHSRGMGLATAPHPEGPWTPYAQNPFLRLEAAPGLRGHISSPELVFRPDRPDEPFWLYFHGDALQPGARQQSCVAASADGITWRLLSPHETVRAAYARVFKRGEWFYMLLKEERIHCLARSRDGLAWERWPCDPVIQPEASESEFDRVRHTGILVERDTLYLFYCVPTCDDLSREEIKLATFSIAGDDWLEWGPLRRHGVVFSPQAEWEENDVRDPFLLRSGDALYLYYVGGHEAAIGLAKTSASALDRLVVSHSGASHGRSSTFTSPRLSA